jgi:Fic family protein
MPTREAILQALYRQSQTAHPWLVSSELASVVGTSKSTVKRHLDALVDSGEVIREGRARSTRYRISASSPAVPTVVHTPFSGFALSAKSQALLASLTRPLGARDVVGYQRAFVDDYTPNSSSLLPPALAHSLASEGRLPGQQPAGTYARKVLEPLLIDLSWSSSRLEGNRYSLLATEALFQSGNAGGDTDAVMLLNHKAAIEFLVDAVPEYGLTPALIRNLHAILMQDLLVDAYGLGSIRQKVVNISDTTYTPSHVPSLLEEMFELIVEKARQIKNPVEAAFFLWVNLAYLQPFEDGNKRTGRLSANIPLMLYNCAPLSFLDIEQQDYAYAMMGIYEHRDVALAAELFEWAYRRSVAKYAVTLEAMGAPDPVRLRLRNALNDAIGMIVRDGASAEVATGTLALAGDTEVFRKLLSEELRALGTHNCARYRLSMRQTQQWVMAGRPH